MNEIKSIEDILKERDMLADGITSDIENFLRNNPDVKDIEITKSVYEIETRCGIVKDIVIGIKLIM